MRKTLAHALPFIGAIAALVVLFSPSGVHAAATYTTDGMVPFVNGITLRSGGEIIAAGKKTNQDVLVVLSIDPGLGGGGVSYITGYENYRFTKEKESFVFEFRNSLGATGSSTVTIDNIDRTPPIITIDPYSTALTNASVEVFASTNEGSLNTPSHVFADNGSFDFVVTDEAGNISTSTVAISTIDTQAPVITLTGADSVESRVNTTFTDPGATATDNMDTSVTVTKESTVDETTVGTYALTYHATDTAGNSATPITRTVVITPKSSGGGGGGGGSGAAVRVGSVSASVGGRVLGASTYNFTRDLALKDTGEDVKALQQLLVSLGFLKEAPTGYFGVKTRAAVKAYQAAHGISMTGVLGPLTRTTLNGTVTTSPATTSTLQAQIALLMTQVKLLQAKLAALPY